MTDRVELWVPGRPVPAARPRVVNGHAYTPQRYRDWKSGAAFRLRTGTTARFDGPVSVQVRVGADGVEVAVESVPPSRPKGVRGDVDNYVKAALDALVDSGVIGDDVSVQSVCGAFLPMDVGRSGR